MNTFIIISIFLGILAGIFAGMGMGGGTFLIPLLIIFLSFTQLQAQSINLIAFIPMALVALIIHLKNKLVNYRTAFLLIIFAILGCLLGVLILQIISLSVLKIIYSIFLLTVGIWLLVDAFINVKKNKNFN